MHRNTGHCYRQPLQGPWALRGQRSFTIAGDEDRRNGGLPGSGPPLALPGVEANGQKATDGELAVFHSAKGCGHIVMWQNQAEVPAPNPHEPPPARRRKKRHCSGDRAHRDKVLGPTKIQASPGKRAATQAAASLTESPSSDKDKLSHTDAGETGDSSDHESVVDSLGGLPHVMPQTAEYII
ncbi:hypothetical protein NDU88_002545 [Pleurodeles waltl]|uniref:Uncharacterized protein n=1 Tax=Pleurodeles waltl TaxID=8319 RepID=A0AAV7UWH4_PLEWA|nr:hypothetical protein NDU88_002545 [Pleurodeles waltl]